MSNREAYWSARFGADVTQVTLPVNNTPLSPDNAAKALAQAYTAVVGQAPSEGILNLLIGQTALESFNWGNGVRSHDTPNGKKGSLYGMPNYNFGGIKATPSDPFIQVVTTTEGDGAAAKTMDLKFAAYQSAADGAAAYIRMFKRHPKWWDGLMTGTPEGFIDALRCGVYGQAVQACKGDYFTGNKDSYLAGLKARIAQHPGLAAQYMNAQAAAPADRIPSDVSTDTIELPDDRGKYYQPPKASTGAKIAVAAVSLGVLGWIASDRYAKGLWPYSKK